MIRFLTAFLVLFAVALPSSAHAYMTEKDKFTAALSEPAYSENLMGVLTALMKRNGITCNEQSSMRRSEPTTLQRIKFRDGDKMPYSGRWEEIIFLQGCGTRTQFNFLVTADDNGGQPNIVPLVPGLTEIDPVNQADAITKAILYAQTTNPKCQDMFVAYTQFFRFRNPNLTDKHVNAWFEKWYVDVCGSEKEVIMQFIPDESFNRFKIQAELNMDYDPNAEDEEKSYKSDYDDY